MVEEPLVRVACRRARCNCDLAKFLCWNKLRIEGGGLLVRRRFRNSFPRMSAMWFVPGDLVLFAVFELGEPVEDDTYRRLWGFSCVVADRFGQNELLPIQ